MNPLFFSLLLCFVCNKGSASIFMHSRNKRSNIVGHGHHLRSLRTLRNIISISGGSSKDVIAPAKEIVADRAKGFTLLAFCIVLEIFATCSMKFQANTKDNRWYLGVFGGYFLCFTVFPIVLEHLPLGLAYATWCGLGMAATVYIANKYFGEDVGPMKTVCLVLIGIGIVGLNMLSGGH